MAKVEKGTGGKARGQKGRGVAEVVVEINERLPRVAGGLTKKELVALIGNTSVSTVTRALELLKHQYDAPIECRRNRWSMDERLALPLLAPEDDDVVAVLLAAEFVRHVAEEDLCDRLRALAEQLDDRRREKLTAVRFPSRAISASLTLATRVHEPTLRALVKAVNGGVVRMGYKSPWTNVLVKHTVEPWELRVHDGTIYLRGWCRGSGGPRTFRLTHVRDGVETLEEAPSVPRPTPEQTWAAGNPAFGIDEDRPDVAVIRIRGAAARWVAPMTWSPAQRDVWVEHDELLERTLPYQSCREIARRVLSIIESVEFIGPPALEEEVERSIEQWRRRRRKRARPAD